MVQTRFDFWCDSRGTQLWVRKSYSCILHGMSDVRSRRSHAGYGFQTSWGTAEKALELLDGAFANAKAL